MRNNFSLIFQTAQELIVQTIIPLQEPSKLIIVEFILSLLWFQKYSFSYFLDISYTKRSSHISNFETKPDYSLLLLLCQLTVQLLRFRKRYSTMHLVVKGFVTHYKLCSNFPNRSRWSG